MDHAVFFQHGVAGPDDSLFAVDGEGEYAADHIGDLGVGMAVELADGTLFKGVLHAHEAVRIGQHPANDIFAAGLGKSTLMGHPALFLFRHTSSSSVFRTAPGPASIRLR